MLVLWTLSAFCVITGTSWYHRITPERRDAFLGRITKFFQAIQTATKLYWILALYFAFRVIYSLGIVLSLEVIAMGALLHYIKRENVRTRKSDEFWLAQALKKPEAAAAFLNTNIPPWVSFPAVERTAWLDKFVENMWKEIATATEGTLISWIDWYLDYYRPGFLTKLHCGPVKMGDVPFKFNGVEVHTTQTETILDFHISWIGDPDIRIIAGMGPVELEVIVTDFQLQAVMRCGFGPHIPQWPCFAAMTTAFVDKPEIDFKLNAAKMSLDLIPGLSDWLDNFLRDVLVWCMVHPKRLVIPMVADFDKAKYGYVADPLGTLMITIKSCAGLPKKIMSPDVYVKVLPVGSDKKPRKTETISSTVNPSWGEDGESFRFTIFDPSEQLRMQVMDRATLKALKVVEDRMIGEVTVFANAFMDGEPHEIEVALANKEKAGDTGKLRYSAKFLPFSTVKDVNEEGEGMTPRPPNHGPPIDDSASVASSSTTPRIPRSRLPPKAGSMERGLSTGSFAQGNDRKGILFLNIISCKGLKNIESIGKSDPFVVASVGKHTCKTPVVKNNLDPNFWFESQLDVESTKTQVLQIEVFDWEALGSDRLLGQTVVPIADVVRSNGKIANDWMLKPTGSIKMELRLMLQ